MSQPPMDTSFEHIENWPQPVDEQRIPDQLQRWQQTADRADADAVRKFVTHLPSTAAGQRMLNCVFGFSPFLSECLIAEPEFVSQLWERGPDEPIQACLEELRNLPGDSDEEAVNRALRTVRRRVALAIALADIADVWQLEQVTKALSDLADESSAAAVRFLLRQLASRGAFELADPDAPEADSGLIVLGLGKLGGLELNYSSDIDLILLYDEDRVRTDNVSDLQRQFVRLARGLVNMLSTRTQDGYVFRVDLRLRPDPGATPLAVSTRAAEHYYEGRGQTWERAALIKARAIAGDRAAAAEFLETISPFVWRRHLDFATVQELHGIKRQLDAHHGSRGIQTLGHNLKLGRGGIREIEFFAQSHQLIWGGKDLRLRTPATIPALEAMVAAQHIPPHAVAKLSEAYRFLRRAEHRLQMMEDEQTQSLPTDPTEYESFTRFLGSADGEQFSQELRDQLQGVEQQYAEFFELPLQATQPTMISSEPEPETIARLERMGFTKPDAVVEILGKWRSGRYRAARGTRSRELLETLTPALLNAMLGTADPDLALARFDRMLEGLPAGLQAFALFQANLHVMETVAEIMVSAPGVADQLTQHPALFEALLESDAAGIAPDRDALRADLDLHLAPARDYEDALERIGKWVETARFRTAIHLLFGRIDPLNAAPVLSEVADCALAAVLQQASSEFAKRHGVIEGAEVAILAMGRLGAREMTVTSDLDLVLIYDAPEDQESNGENSIVAARYYHRLLRRLISGLTVQTGQGQIYEIDMRLRPSGNSGPLATSVASFEHYHAEQAWTWERLALTRARVAVGSESITQRLEQIIRDTLSTRQDPEQVRTDTAEMREKMAGAFATDNPWSVKHYRGGLVDIEFIAQYLLLREMPEHPDVRTGNTGDAIQALAKIDALPAGMAETLHSAWCLWSRMQAYQRLLREDADETDIPTRLQSLFANAAEVESFSEIKARLLATAEAVRECYGTIVGPITS